MPVTMYHNPRCNTSRRTLALLREKSVAGIKAPLLSKRQSVAGIRLVLEGPSRRKEARLDN
jgi:arsenate reductase-like glutaredoxin family protein